MPRPTLPLPLPLSLTITITIIALPLMLSAAACAPPDAAEQGEETGAVTEYVPLPVLNIGMDQLHVARLVLDLDVTIARFVEPARSLPLDRVELTLDDEEPVDLGNVITDCLEECPAGDETCRRGYEITGGADFVVGQGEGFIDVTSGSDCTVCGWAVICMGSCGELGPGSVPRGDPSQYDVDPAEGGDTGVDGGGSGGSDGDSGSGDSGSHGDSGSGASSGGEGGSHGGVGNPGGWD